MTGLEIKVDGARVAAFDGEDRKDAYAKAIEWLNYEYAQLEDDASRPAGPELPADSPPDEQ
jgi:hypothetical protein